MSRYKKRARKNNNIGIIMIAVVAVALVAAFVVQNSKRQEANRFDKATFCPKNGDTSITVIMIDQTDPLSPVQQASLRNELEEVRDKIPTHGKLEVYAVGTTVSQTLKPVFSMCSPGNGKDVSGFDANPQLIERRWKEAFDKPLDRILDKLLSAPAAKESPILESIQSIAVTTFNKPSSAHATKQFIIASDMIHYTPEFSLYQQPSDYDELRKTDYFRKMRAHLDAVNVKVLMFRRTTGPNVQDEAFINFWTKFFNDQGAIVEGVDAIDG